MHIKCVSNGIFYAFYYLHFILFYDMHNLKINFISSILQHMLGLTNGFTGSRVLLGVSKWILLCEWNIWYLQFYWQKYIQKVFSWKVLVSLKIWSDFLGWCERHLQAYVCYLCCLIKFVILVIQLLGFSLHTFSTSWTPIQKRLRIFRWAIRR